jgi:hypothetical protein
MALSSREAFAEALNHGLADEEAQALRERIALEIPASLASNGLRLSIHHELESNVAGIGFATATEMAAELGEGARRLFETELWYPGAALVRQLIECGYLLTLMAQDPTEARTWMTSAHKDIVARFQPRHMRQRAVRNFRASEYQTHCDLGGHPNPAGRTLLRRQEQSRPLSPRSHWLDLAQHLAETWNSFESANPLYDPRADVKHWVIGPERLPDGHEEITRLLAAWREADPVAARGSVPETLGNPSE